MSMSYRVVLKSVESKLAAVKVLTMIPGVSEDTAISIVSSLPATVKEGISEEEAKFISELLSEGNCVTEVLRTTEETITGPLSNELVDVDQKEAAKTPKPNFEKRLANVHLPIGAKVLVIVAALLSIPSAISVYEGLIENDICDLLSTCFEFAVWCMVINSLAKNGNLASGLKAAIYGTFILIALSSISSILYLASYNPVFTDISGIISLIVLAPFIAWLIIACKNYKGAMAKYPIVLILCGLGVLLISELTSAGVNHSIGITRLFGVLSLLPYYYLYKLIDGE